MQFSYSAYQIKQALWQICLILIFAVIFGLVSNTVRKQHLPLIGDWSTEGRLTTDRGKPMGTEVIFEIKGSVAIITLNRPDRKNAINQALLTGLYNSVEKIAENDEIKVGIITGIW